jgi:hypothetical protein
MYDTVLSIEYRMTGPVSKNIVFFTLKLSTCMVVFNQRPNRVERKTDIPHHHKVHVTLDYNSVQEKTITKFKRDFVIILCQRYR